MEDQISRRITISRIKRFLEQTDAPEVYPGLIPALEQVINNVPSIKPEVIHCEELSDTQSQHKRGKWIPMSSKYIINGYWFECSECGRAVPEVRNGGWSFCPACGAKMKVPDDQQGEKTDG